MWSNVTFRRPVTQKQPRKPKYERKSVKKEQTWDKFAIIKYPLSTESAIKTIEDNNTLVFMVDRRANKPMIKKACHDLYETVEVFRGISLVRVRPQTGRTHEVRLALRTLGTPCAVDPLYGTSEPLLLSAWKRDYRTGRGRTERPLIDRLTLHAESIAFAPPGSDPEDHAAWLRVEAPLPKDMASTLRQLRKHAAPGSL